MIFLYLASLLHVAQRALGHAPDVRDHGLLESALVRPQATTFGADAYEDVHHKASALLHSLAGNDALVDGNKRLALAAVVAFHAINGRRLTLTNDEAYDLVFGVAAGQLDDVVARIAAVLETGTQTR